MLETLGLSGTAEAVYRAMLAHPQSGVGDISALAGLSEIQVREALDELADLALLHQSAQADSGFRAVRPEVGLAALLSAAVEEAARKQREVEATRAAIATIAAEHRTGGALEDAIRLEGVDTVRARLEELSAAARTECLSMNPGGAHKPEARVAGRLPNQQALERGVALRAICRESFHNDADTVAHAHQLTELGAQIRTVPTVPMPMVVVDRTIAILPLDPDDSTAGAIEVRSPGVLAAACALFEQTWSVGHPFGQPVAPDQYGCTAQERALITILAAGHTDENAARRLGISLRTVRRMMSNLMERLGADSRFQAGINAARRGWL